MKREIKFRGLCVATQEWVYGDLINYSENEKKILESNFRQWDILEGGYEVIPESVGQYTGLKDRNGVDIYEGDIVTRNEYPFFDLDGDKNYVATVEWIFNGWQTILHCVNPDKRGISSGMNEQIEDDTEHNTDFTVIGNIHEHKHLLK